MASQSNGNEPPSHFPNNDDQEFEVGKEDLQKIEAMLRRCEDLDNLVTADISALNAKSDDYLRDLAGPNLSLMLKNPQETERFIFDPDPKLRQAALRILHEYWQMSGSIVKVYEQLALNDPDIDVRGESIVALGASCANTKNLAVERLLASIIVNETEPEESRVLAYNSLHLINGTRHYVLGIGEIDRTFAQSFL
jgi:hypothetical protein